MQVTRGVAERAHQFPKNAAPSLVVTAKSIIINAEVEGKKAITTVDERWERRDIKTINLLPNCIAKQKAIENDAYEAIMVMEDGTISEGASSNLWMVNGDNQIITRNASNVILNGITKLALTTLADIHCYKVVEKPFTVDEAINAKELFVTSATAIVTPVSYTHLTLPTIYSV